MSQQSWTNLIATGLFLSTIAAFAAFVAVVPRRPLVWVLAISSALTTIVYVTPPGIHGADDFHPRLGLALVVALIVGWVYGSAWAQRSSVSWGPRIAVLAVAVFGVFAPVLLLFVFLAVGCSGGACST